MRPFRALVTLLTLLAVGLSSAVAKPCCCATITRAQAGQEKKACCTTAKKLAAARPCCAKHQASSHVAGHHQSCACLRSVPAAPASREITTIAHSLETLAPISWIEPPTVQSAAPLFQRPIDNVSLSGPPLLAMLCTWLN